MPSPGGSLRPVRPASRSRRGARWVAVVALAFIVVVVLIIVDQQQPVANHRL